MHPAVEHDLKLAEFITYCPAVEREDRLSTFGPTCRNAVAEQVMMVCLLALVWLSGPVKILL
jgi:hypothetical protein